MSEAIRFDGIIWLKNGDYLTPICPIHRMEMDRWVILGNEPNLLKCADCDDVYELPRTHTSEQDYILRKLRSKNYSDLKVLNLDDEQIPVASDKVEDPESPYFVTARLMQSKIGLRLVVYAGKKGAKTKTQIFVEPGIKRLAFDQKDMHPADVFASLEATFQDGTTQKISGNKDTK